MKLSQLIKQLQELEKEHGGDIDVDVYLYKEISPIRYIGVRDVYSMKGEKEIATPTLCIEGNKHYDK